MLTLCSFIELIYVMIKYHENTMDLSLCCVKLREDQEIRRFIIPTYSLLNIQKNFNQSDECEFVLPQAAKRQENSIFHNSGVYSVSNTLEMLASCINAKFVF